MWAGEDSNLRRQCRRVYSPFPLATRAPTQERQRLPVCPAGAGSFTDMPTFDVVSEVDLQEVRNAVDQAAREVATRFDFKDTNSRVELGDGTITLASITEDRLTALRQVLEEKLVKRKISLKSIEFGNVEDATGSTVRQVATLTAGINSDKSREINKFLKALGIKGLQSQTQGEQIRVQHKKRDALQEAMAALKDEDFGVPLQYQNFRD